MIDEHGHAVRKLIRRERHIPAGLTDFLGDRLAGCNRGGRFRHRPGDGVRVEYHLRPASPIQRISALVFGHDRAGLRCALQGTLLVGALRYSRPPRGAGLGWRPIKRPALLAALVLGQLFATVTWAVIIVRMFGAPSTNVAIMLQRSAQQPVAAGRSHRAGDAHRPIM